MSTGPGAQSALMSRLRTLATGLAGRTFPFIRYDLGDEVTLLPGRCPCGSSMLRVADIAGRRDDDFRYGEDLVPASAFRYVLGTDPPLISEYQVRQTVGGADVHVIGSPDVSAVAAALVSALRRFGLSNPQISVLLSRFGVTPQPASSGGSSRWRTSSLCGVKRRPRSRRPPRVCRELRHGALPPATERAPRWTRRLRRTDHAHSVAWLGATSPSSAWPAISARSGN